MPVHSPPLARPLRKPSTSAGFRSFLAPAYVGYILQFMLFGSFVTNFFSYIGTSNHRDDRRTNKI